jgi:hypothetical protein
MAFVNSTHAPQVIQQTLDESLKFKNQIKQLGEKLAVPSSKKKETKEKQISMEIESLIKIMKQVPNSNQSILS